MLPRIHLALRQFVRPIGPANQGSSSLTQDKPLVQPPELKEEEAKQLTQRHGDGKTFQQETPDSEEGSSPSAVEASPNTDGADLPAESSQRPKVAFWNPNELLQLIKRIVSTDALNKRQMGKIEYQSIGRRSQKGLALKKGTVLDKKAA